jgi:neutral ceramidase
MTGMLRTILLGFIFAILAVPAPAAELRAGRAAVDITPPRGMPMAGYYYVRLNEGTHDPLQAKALVLEKDGTKAAMVALDVGNIARHIVEAAREHVGKMTAVPGANVMISATHSHTGPEMGGRLRGVDTQTEQLARQYITELPRKIAESVRLAEADLQPARVRTTIGHEDSLSFIRRYYMKDGSVGWNPGKRNPNILRPAGEIDPDIPIVAFETPAGKPLAVYVNFACHLDTVGGMQFSADYAYTLSRLLAEAKAPDLMTLFTIGAAGNINHIDTSSAEPQKGHIEAARIGTILAGDVLKAWRGLQPVEPGALRVASETVNLPAAEYQPDDVAKARRIVANYGKPNADPFYEQVHAFKVLDLEERGRRIEAEVQTIALGDRIAWVGMPGEIFVEHGKALKVASPFPQTILAELANGSVGYVPDRKAYPQGAYEVISARVGPGAGELMVAVGVKQLTAARGRAIK